MNSLSPLIFVILASLSLSALGSAADKPNVVFIIVDDLNDMPYQPDGKPVVPTPNIDRLKAQGVTFTNAHTNDPLCAPSRASMHFGLYPQTTSLYWFEDWRDNGIYSKSVSLQDNLRAGGYAVWGTGKIYHGNQTGLFDEYGHHGDIGPWPWDGRKETQRGFLQHPQQLYLYEGIDADMDYKWEHVFGPLSEVPDWPADPANGVPGYKGWRLYGKPWKYVDDQDRDPLADELGARWAAEMIGRERDKPFALFAGLVRTHTPLYAPQEYFDRFPLESIELPTVDPDDLQDVSSALGNESLYGFRRYRMLFNHGDRDLFRKWLQAYMACVSFVDDQVGVILDAIEASPDRESTVIFFTSDHGFHVGEKNFLYKGSLWDPSTRIPLIIAGVEGGKKGKTTHQPVSLIDIYPTFNDICGLEKNPNRNGNGYELEGHSLLPLVKDPQGGKWTGPDVAITALPGKDHMLHKVYEGSLYPHFSIRGERYRYSLASDGGEELYDHERDPYEWTNLANHPEYDSIKAELRKKLEGLRDGDHWELLQSANEWLVDGAKRTFKRGRSEIHVSSSEPFVFATKRMFENFEFEGELRIVKGASVRLGYREGDSIEFPAFGSPESKYGNFKPGEWNRYRMRVHGKRHQLWINNRVVRDELKTDVGHSGSIRLQSAADESVEAHIRNARVRPL